MTHDKPNLSPKIALYEPDIPQNTASIIRTCSCLGAQLEIIEPCGFLLTDKRFKRVVMDYLEEDKIKFYKNADDFFNNKKNQRVILITTKGVKSYTEFNFKINDTLLFGRDSSFSLGLTVFMNFDSRLCFDVLLFVNLRAFCS